MEKPQVAVMAVKGRKRTCKYGRTKAGKCRKR